MIIQQCRKYSCGLKCNVGNPDFHCGFNGQNIDDIKHSRPKDCESLVIDIQESLIDKDGEPMGYKTKW